MIKILLYKFIILLENRIVCFLWFKVKKKKHLVKKHLKETKNQKN